MYEAIRSARRRAVGTKQALKAAARGAAAAVYVAGDADPQVLQNLLQVCREKGIPVHQVESMAELGKACGIKVGAASAAIVKDIEEGGAELAYD